MLESRIADDLKAAMLAGDKTRVEALKMLKSALLYKAVELGVRDSGLTDEQIVEVLSKEAKKRLDAAQMYQQAGNAQKAAAETSENDLIRQYLPAQLSDEDLEKLVNDVIAEAGEVSIKDMGRVIGLIKQKAGNTVDGSRVATLVKEKLS